MTNVLPVLVVSAEPEHREILAGTISDCGLQPISRGTFADAKDLLAREAFSMVVCEDTLPNGDFRAVIEAARLVKQMPVVIVVSRKDDWASCLVATGAGAFDYVAFPPYPGELERALSAALSQREQPERMTLPKAA